MDNLELRQMDYKDLEFLLEVRNHESTRNFLENDSVFTIDQCREWFQKLTSPWYIILVNGLNVGYIRTDDNEVGCDIHPNHRRKGYAKQAYIKYLENRDLATLWVFDDNFAKNLYLELGFVENGEFKIVRDRKYIRMVYEK
jgi:hypothetical protein